MQSVVKPMAQTDGSIRFNVDLDDKQAQAELNRLVKKIDALNDKIYQEKQARMPLVEQSKQLGAQLDEAKAKLDAMQNATPGTISSDAIRGQKETVKSLQAQWDGVDKQVVRYDRSIAKSESELDRAADRAGELSKALMQNATISDLLPIAAQKFKSILKETVNSLNVSEKFKSALLETGSILGDVAKAVGMVGKGLITVLKLCVSFVKKLKPVFTVSAKFIKSTAKVIASVAKQTIKFTANFNVFSKLIGGLKEKLGRLGSMIRRVFVFSVITAGLRAVREQMSQYLKLNDQFYIALGQIKGALLTAFQPIYDVAVPALATLLNHLTNLIAASAEFIATLFGTTAKQAQDNAKSLYEQAQAAEEAGEAVEEEGNHLEEAGEQAEEAAKAFASFDEINQLSFNEQDKSKDENKQDLNDKLADEVKPTFGLELSDTVFQTWGEAFDALLDKILQKGIPKLKQGFSNFANWLNGLSKKLLDMFTFDGILDKVKEIGQQLAEALNNLVRKINWHQLGAALGAGLNLALAGLVAFLYNFDWMNLGHSLAEFVNGLVEQVDWYNFGKLLWAGFMIALETLAGFILGLDMKKLAQAFNQAIYGFFDSMIETIQKIPWKRIGVQIATFLNNIDWMGIFTKVAAALALAFNALITLLQTIVSSVKWEEISAAIGGAISTLIQKIDWKGLFSLIVSTITTGLNGAVNSIAPIIKTLDWRQIGTEIGTAFQNLILDIDWVNLFTTLAEFLTGLTEGLTAAISAVDWQAVGTAILNGLAAVDWVTLFGSIGELIGSAIAAVIELFFSKEGLSLLWDIAKAIVKGILDGLMNVLTLGQGPSLSGKQVWTGFGSSSGGFGGRSFSLPRPAESYEIPALARGAVIPPNREFLAVLGDQRSGTNIEAPTSEIEAAVARGVAAANAGGNGGPMEIKLVLSAKPGIAREMKVELDKETRRRGVKLVQGV